MYNLFLPSYKQRKEIEVMFNSYKNFLKADKMYRQNRIVLEDWLMANFIAMIAYYKLHQKLRTAKMFKNILQKKWLYTKISV